MLGFANLALPLLQTRGLEAAPEDQKTKELLTLLLSMFTNHRSPLPDPSGVVCNSH